jgi:hypothetical protein
MDRFTCDNCPSEPIFTVISEQIFFAGVAISTAPIQKMLYDSPRAQDRSWAATRRISHGPAIRHQQPSRPGLQHGRHNRGLGRNVDRRRALFCAADGCLGGHLHVEPVSEQACSLSLSWFGHNVAPDFDRDDWLLTLLSSGCAHGDSDLHMARANKEQRLERLVLLGQRRALGDIIEPPGAREVAVHGVVAVSHSASPYVRYGSLADIPRPLAHVR